MKNQLKSGVLISYATMLISNITPMIYTPIMLRILGQAEYGVSGIATSIGNYLYLLNMGLGGTIVRYLAKYRANGERDKEEHVAGMFIQIYSIISVIIISVGFFIAHNIHHYDNALMPNELILLKKLIILNTINTAIFMPFNVMGSILVAHEEFIINKGVAFFTTLLTPILNLTFLYAGWGSIGFPIVTMITNTIGYSIYTPYALRKIGIRPRFGKPDWALLKEIFQFTMLVFLTRIVDALYWSTDRLIIGWSLGSIATAVYNIGAVFNGHVSSFSNAISSVLVPKLTNMEVQNASPKQFTEIFIRIGRLQFIIVSFIVSAFIAFGRQFISLWAGSGYENAYWVAIFTMLPATIGLIQNTGTNILYAKNKHMFRAFSYLCMAILNIVLTFIWVNKYGIIGASFATCIACILEDGVIMNVYYLKKTKIDIPLFWKNILKMSPVMLIMGTTAWFLLDWFIINSWIKFFSYALVYSIVYFILSYVFMMNNYEKGIMLAPLLKFKKLVLRK